MQGKEAEHGTTAAPDNTTLGAEVSSVVPDRDNTASKAAEKTEVRLHVSQPDVAPAAWSAL